MCIFGGFRDRKLEFCMAMVVQANCMTNGKTSTVSMDSYQPLQPKSGSSTPSSPPRSASPTNNQDDSFRRMIFDKVEEGKCDTNPDKCRQILDDLMKMLKHLTADVNNYNLAFRETRPPFYMQVRHIFHHFIEYLFDPLGISTINRSY